MVYFLLRDSENYLLLARQRDKSVEVIHRFKIFDERINNRYERRWTIVIPFFKTYICSFLNGGNDSTDNVYRIQYIIYKRQTLFNNFPSFTEINSGNFVIYSLASHKKTLL